MADVRPAWVRAASLQPQALRSEAWRARLARVAASCRASVARPHRGGEWNGPSAYPFPPVVLLLQVSRGSGGITGPVPRSR